MSAHPLDIDLLEMVEAVGQVGFDGPYWAPTAGHLRECGSCRRGLLNMVRDRDDGAVEDLFSELGLASPRVTDPRKDEKP